MAHSPSYETMISAWQKTVGTTDKISKEHGTEYHFLATTSTVIFRNLDRKQRRDMFRGKHGGLLL